MTLHSELEEHNQSGRTEGTEIYQYEYGEYWIAIRKDITLN